MDVIPKSKLRTIISIIIFAFCFYKTEDLLTSLIVQIGYLSWCIVPILTIELYNSKKGKKNDDSKT